LQRATAPQPIANRVGIAAMITDQLVLTRIKPKVSAALITRKAVFVDGGYLLKILHGLKIAVKRLRRHNPQRIVTQIYGGNFRHFR
jgi:hypothetical protein